MSYVEAGVWSCPHPGCGTTVRGNTVARRTQQRACARRHGFPEADTAEVSAVAVAPSLAGRAGLLVIPRAPKGARRQK